MNIALFRWINAELQSPFLDRVIPLFSEREMIVIPLLTVLGFLLVWGSTRTRLAVVAMVLAFGFADFGSEQVIKPLIGQDRPYVQLADVRVYQAGNWTQRDPGWDIYQRRPDSHAFPSSHAANAAAFAVVCTLLHPLAAVVAVPAALLVGFSRVYTGNHFPGDVLGGFVWGSICGVLAWALIMRLWRWRAGPVEHGAILAALPPERRTLMVLLTVWTFFNLFFIHLNLFDLAADEAQYWDWSRHLDLGYYSKPPLIAYLIKGLTKLGGHSPWSIRSGAVLLSVGSAAFLYLLTWRISGKERTALLAVVLTLAMPATWAGSILMTIDPLLAFFWIAAMYCFHRAVAEGRYWWIATGLMLGGGLLSKYTMAVLLLSFAAYLLLVDRRWLRKPGPYLALAIAAISMSGVLYWNWRHDWISFRHTAAIGAPSSWNPLKALGWFAEFWGGQLGVVSPILFLLLMWGVYHAARGFRQNRDLAFLFLCFAGLFGFYALIALTRLPNINWPICAYLAAAPAAALAWEQRPRGTTVRRWLAVALLLGCFLGIAPRGTDLLYAAGIPVNPDLDPTNKLRGGKELGEAVAKYVIPGSHGPFAFSDRYQMTSLTAFYTRGRPHAMCVYLNERRYNQYDLWGGWDELVGRDGLFIAGGDRTQAQFWVEGMVYAGLFDRGEVLETVEVRRGNTLIHTYTLSRLYNYSGKVLHPAHATY